MIARRPSGLQRIEDDLLRLPDWTSMTADGFSFDWDAEMMTLLVWTIPAHRP